MRIRGFAVERVEVRTVFDQHHHLAGGRAGDDAAVGDDGAGHGVDGDGFESAELRV